MNGKKGFISIIALVTISILLVMSLYLLNISQLENLILNAGDNKTKSYYQSEGKIHLSLCDDKYYSDQLYLNLIQVFRANNFGTLSKKVTINEEDLDFGDDKKDIWLKFTDKENRIIMDIIANSNVNGVKSEVTSSGPVVNHLFEASNPIVSLNSLEEIEKNNLQDLLENIKENISIHNCYKNDSVFGIELENFNECRLSRKNNGNYKISSKRDKMMNPHVDNFVQNEIFIIARGKENEKFEIFLGDPEEESNINLSGIIFVEGDLIISNDFEFRGIVVVVNGKILNEFNKQFKIEGLLITDSMEDYNDFIENNNIIYARDMIYRYGTYLPGFLDPKISVIKGF